jgi:hypothetical protein
VNKVMVVGTGGFMFLVEMEAVIGVHRGPMYYNA